jgi:hypothetical protein
MEEPEGSAVTGERKAVTGRRFRSRETGKGCGVPQGVNPGTGKTVNGESMVKRSTLWNAMLNAVHAGGEQGCESGHLEPFLFSGSLLALSC